MPDTTPALTFSTNADAYRYEAHIGGELAGYAEFNSLTDALLFTHTEVLPAFEGKGVGSGLARHVLDDARRQGKQVIPVCPFIAGHIRKHREYADLVRADVQRAFKI